MDFVVFVWVVVLCFLMGGCVFVYSGRIPCPHPGRIWVEQRGLQRALYWHIEARVVLDLKEFPDLVSFLESMVVFNLYIDECKVNKIL